ncbi:NPD-domain-containing protein [Aureobasidium pullulans]|uniref:NPD-domain-containing protein n=1 Tax=Aureobasidium pullulans TaxID=5580 RepID=A0A4S9ES61_AURPU|nr:NPD-domain-containing protein [Aureobasidium pullulans]THX36563.1 NPD-domain-containing protein [Aureobasidium pullulans]
MTQVQRGLRGGKQELKQSGRSGDRGFIDYERLLPSINHPVMLAGMNVAAGPKLAAAVTNAGGLGVIGGVGYTPDMLREQIAELKSYLKDKNAPFGVDLLLPQVGGSARKTNYDYTKGKLDELVDIIIDSKASLFVSAVGVPPKHIVEKLHKAGVLYMNMIGHPKHVKKCLEIGVDMICAQGGEGGGHTGDVPTTILIPTVVKMCEGHKSPLTGKPVQVIAAGGLFNGQSLAAALMLGATAVWIGTRFVLSEEAGASKAHQEAVRTSGFDDNVRTIIFTGRPLRVRKNPYIEKWENERQAEIKKLTSEGVIPVEHDLESLGDDLDDDTMDNARPFLMGKAAAVVNERQSAKQIVDEMVGDAVTWIGKGNSAIVSKSKL